MIPASRLLVLLGALVAGTAWAGKSCDFDNPEDLTKVAKELGYSATAKYNENWPYPQRLAIGAFQVRYSWDGDQPPLTATYCVAHCVLMLTSAAATSVVRSQPCRLAYCCRG